MLALLLMVTSLDAAGVEVGQFDNPRDLTLKIHDPYAQENTDLMQPVVGSYKIKVLPGYLSGEAADHSYDCRGLYFKQVGKLIYIDIRKPPEQKKAGAYDLSVSLSVPDQPDSSNRLRRHIVYTDAATDVLLVIDNSRSMKKNDPYGMRFQACENFVHLASLSQSIQNVGIVKFSGSAKVVLPWMDPKRAKGRRIGRLLSQSKPGNFTNINEAFELCSDLFEDSVATEKVVVLLTDGKNEPDIYRDTHDLLKELGVRVYTVGLSALADTEQLNIISQDTGGEFFAAADDAKLMRIYNKIAQQLSEFRSMKEGVASNAVTFPVTTHDNFVDINLYNYPKGTEFELLNGQGVAVQSSAVMGDGKDSTKLMRISRPSAGTYTLRAKGKDVRFSYDMNTHSRLFMKMFPMEKKYLSGEVAHIAVSLAQMEVPMLGAEIKARIMSSDAKVYKELTLYDDGVHGDNHANDGVYCAITPLDLEEGYYQVELEAKGQTPSGESFVRLQKDKFYVLEASDTQREYFLASILPLYLDLGEVEQGQLATASLRVSFEGREPRKLELVGGDDLAHVSLESDVVPWEAFQFPEGMNLKPSQAEVLTVKLKVPVESPLGAYSGTFLVRMGDQEVLVPVDLRVKAGALARVAPVMSEPEAPKPRLMDLDEHRMESPELPALSMVGEFSPLETSMPEPEGFDLKEVGKTHLDLRDASLDVAKTVPPKPETPVPPIQFAVSPEHAETFVVEDGQFASMVFELENLSAWAGQIQVELDGVGELSTAQLDLAPGERKEWVWSWEVKESALASQVVHLRFYNEGGELSRTLTWANPPPIKPWFFYVTIAILAFVTVIFGIKYVFGHQTQDAFISGSSLLHLALVIWAFLTLIPQKDLDEEVEVQLEDMVFEMLPEDPPEVPVQQEPEQKVEEIKMRPVEKQQAVVEAKEVSIEKVELQPVKKMSRLPRRSVVKERQLQVRKSDTQLSESERSFEAPSFEVLEPTVLSVNDRPKRRAVLRVRKEKAPEANQIKLEASRAKVLVRKRAVESLVRPSVQSQDVELKDLSRDLSAPEMLAEKQKELADQQLQVKQAQLDLEAEELARLDLKQRQSQQLSAQDLNLTKERLLSEASKDDLSMDKKVMSSGNVRLRELVTSGEARAEMGERSMDAEVRIEPLAVQKVDVNDRLETLEARERGEEALRERQLAADYAEDRKLKRLDKVDMGSMELRSVAERSLSIRSVERERQLPSMQDDSAERVQSQQQPSLELVRAQSMDVVEVDRDREVESSIELSERAGEAAVVEAAVEAEKVTGKVFAQEKEKGTTLQETAFDTVKLDRKELLGVKRRAPLIRERVVGKKIRTRSSSSLLKKGPSPILMGRDRLKDNEE